MFEVKAPLPNSDQSKVSKEKLLKLHAMEPLQVKGAYLRVALQSLRSAGRLRLEPAHALVRHAFRLVRADRRRLVG